MLLRSSSTPVLGSLIPSFSESPNNIPNYHQYEAKPNPNPTLHHSHNKLSIQQSGPLRHTTFSTNSSPISSSMDFDRGSHRGFRRAQSDGNLAGLAYDASSCSNVEDQFSCDSHVTNGMVTRRSKCLTLETIPSFSLHNSGGGFTEDYEDEDEDADVELCQEREDCSDENEGVGSAVTAKESASIYVAEEVSVKQENWDVGLRQRNELAGQGLYLEKGIGIGGGGGGRGGGEFNKYGSSGDGGDKQGVEEYYRKMVEQNPSNSLFLGNYAQFLYQSKGDLKGAEEYYSRAILADPRDAGLLTQYAKLVWELYNDHDRASSYFERAVQASPQDSHVQAAYAKFLWDIEDDDDAETNLAEGLHAMTQKINRGFMTCAND